jgi:hypothetical protein
MNEAAGPLTYSEAVARINEGLNSNTDLPDDGGYRSVLVPTRRFGFDALGCFLAPSRVQQGEPATVGESTIWMAFDVRTGMLALFLRKPIAAVFGSTPAFVRSPPQLPNAEIRIIRQQFTDVMDGLSNAFFDSRAPQDRHRAIELFRAQYGDTEMAALQGAFPDFFEWLFDGSHT